MSTKTPKFLHTLYSLLDIESPTIVAWSPSGTYFQVFNVTRLEKDVLPRYFKHGKFASFQRQLNNFGFRKWTKTRASVCTFSHDTLTRCKPSELPVMMMLHSSTSPVTSSRKRQRAIDVEDTDLSIAPKKTKFEPIRLHDERESITDVSDLLALDWSILSADSPCDELADDDDCVGLPIELFFPADTSADALEPLSLGESTEVDIIEWHMLVACLA